MPTAFATAAWRYVCRDCMGYTLPTWPLLLSHMVPADPSLAQMSSCAVIDTRLHRAGRGLMPDKQQHMPTHTPVSIRRARFAILLRCARGSVHP